MTEVAVGIASPTPSLQGSYAEVRLAPAARLVKLPPAIDDKTAAAMMLKGMTAEYLLLRCARVAARRHDPVPRRGRRRRIDRLPVGEASRRCASSARRAGPRRSALAAARGCDHVIDYDREDIVARVKELTGGAGVKAVFDGVGKRTFDASLACLATRGMLALFGQASGVVPPIDPGLLAQGIAVPRPPGAGPLRRGARRAGQPPRRGCSRSWAAGR